MAIRSAIIGFGLAGRIFHAPLIQCCAGLQLVSVSTSKRSMVPEGLGTGTPAEIIADPDVDLVVVASPNESHFPLAEAALTAGKHVVVDKPMCVSTDEARKLIELAQRTDLLLTVFHNRRWDSDFLTVRKLIASQALGRVTLFEAHWDRFRPQITERWREQPTPGTGLLFDLGPHLIDQALALFGPPDQVHADLAAQREGSLVDDYFALRMDYGSCRVILSASSVVAEPRARFSIHGTAGSFVKFGLDQQEDQLRAGMDPLAAEFGLESPSMSGTLTGGDGARSTVPSERGDWLSFYRGVAASIAGRAPTLVEPEDALIGLKIIEAARHSPQGAWRHDATFA